MIWDDSWAGCSKQNEETITTGSEEEDKYGDTLGFDNLCNMLNNECANSENGPICDPKVKI